MLHTRWAHFPALVATVLCAEVASVPARGAEVVRIPCAIYGEGNTWVYKYQSDQSTGTVEKVVLSKEGDVITIGDSQKSMVNMGSGMQPIQNKGREVLYYEGGALYMISYEANIDIPGQVEMRVPVRGQVPALSKNVAKSDGKVFAEEVRKIRRLGVEKVVVPAGTFDADVFVIEQQTMQPGGMQLQNISHRISMR